MIRYTTDMLVALFLFILGTCIGSFLNVVIRRYIQEKSLTGRSGCEYCGKTLKWYDMIPVLSFILLRGRCRFCQREFSVQYPIIELFIGCVFVIIFFPVMAAPALVPSAIVTVAAISLLTVLLVIDYYVFILPDIFIVLLTLVVVARIIIERMPLTSSLHGVVVGVGFLGFLWLVTRGRGMGFGDVKLLVPLGAMFGFTGTIVLLWFSFITGGLIALYLLVQQQASLKTAIPFGPFLIGFALLFVLLPSLPGELFSVLLGWDILRLL